MSKTYQIEDVEYSLTKVRRSKHIRITISADGRVHVTLPTWTTLKTGHAFVLERLSWIRAQRATLQQQHDALPEEFRIRERFPDTPAHRKQAREILTERLHALNEEYFQKTVNRISIRNMRTRWGSCSNQGNISLSYIVAFLPEPLRDYVVIHELAHLVHMNHSAAFWKLVARADSQYAVHKKEIQQYR